MSLIRFLVIFTILLLVCQTVWQENFFEYQGCHVCDEILLVILWCVIFLCELNVILLKERL